MTSQTLLTTKDVAAYLNVKESTIRHWVHIKYIPHIKFHGAVRYRQTDIDEWLNRCAIGIRSRSARQLANDILRRDNPRTG